jgi:hypothetical protein
MACGVLHIFEMAKQNVTLLTASFINVMEHESYLVVYSTMQSVVNVKISIINGITGQAVSLDVSSLEVDIRRA